MIVEQKILLTDSFLSEQRRAIARCPVTRLTGTATPDDVAVYHLHLWFDRPAQRRRSRNRSVCNFVVRNGASSLSAGRPRLSRLVTGVRLRQWKKCGSPSNAGATLVAATREMMQSGTGPCRHLRAAAVTVVSTVPTLWSMLDETFRRCGCSSSAVRRVRKTSCAGGWKPNRRILNTYGPTEATVTATWSELQLTSRSLSVVPCRINRVYVLDEELQMATEGELPHRRNWSGAAAT